MKINDVLDCINRTLEVEREVRGIPKVLGHFIAYLSVEKGIGHIKSFNSHIDFVNVKTKETYHVIHVQHTIPCTVDKLEEAKEQVMLMALENLFKALRFGADKGAYENFVNGEFQGWT